MTVCTRENTINIMNTLQCQHKGPIIQIFIATENTIHNTGILLLNYRYAVYLKHLCLYVGLHGKDDGRDIEVYFCTAYLFCKSSLGWLAGCRRRQTFTSRCVGWALCQGVDIVATASLITISRTNWIFSCCYENNIQHYNSVNSISCPVPVLLITPKPI